MRLRKSILASLLVPTTFALLSSASAFSQETKIRVAAAANLSGTLNKIAESFTRLRPGFSVELTFGSSGALSAQIRSGAPFDVFLSADVAQAERLAADGFADKEVSSVRVYAIGVLCITSRHGVDASGKLDFLTKGVYKSIAVARPELAPYGAAAVAAVEKSELGPALRDRFIYGSNIGQVVQFVSAGAADAGFVNLSAVFIDPAFKTIPWAKVDQGLYPRIEQAGLVLKPRDAGAGGTARLEAARAFFAYLLSPAGGAALAEAGYALPEQRSP